MLFLRMCARCGPANARSGWRRWAGSRPASPMRSAIRWRPSPRPTRAAGRGTARSGAAAPGAHRRRQRGAAAAHRRRCGRGLAGRAARGAGDRCGAQVSSALRRLVRTAGLRADRDAVLFVVHDQPLPVRFDIEHLRRVLVNPLDNAHRHGSGQPACRLGAACARRRLIELSVASDGAVIAPMSSASLRTFFSTRSRGTGLGLYICRELCERYRAAIEFPSARAFGASPPMLPSSPCRGSRWPRRDDASCRCPHESAPSCRRATPAGRRRRARICAP